MNKKPTEEEVIIFKTQCHRVIEGIEHTLNEKFSAYGKDSVLKPGARGILNTIRIKVERLESLLDGATPAEDNPIEDSWRDLAGWSILGSMLYWEIFPGMPNARVQQNEQKIRLVYLAGPIDLSTPKESTKWREVVAKALSEYNICTFSPAHAFNWVGDDVGAQKLIDINYEALRKSDAFFLYLPDDVQTVGSLIELKIASDLEKPIVIWTHLRKSLYLEPFIKESLITKAIGRIVALND